MTDARMQIIIDGKADSALAATKSVNTSIDGMTKKLQSAAQTMTSVGAKMSLAITAPLILIGKKSLDMAMDVVESENLFEVSMGNMAEAAREWSEAFSESVGLNEYEVRRQVGVFNVMLTSMGLTEQAALDMSQGMTELAYDMASFYNLKPEEAFDKIKSGIVGMSRPLQDLGILVNDTTIKQTAYKNGLVEVGAELTESEKVLARYQTIMERTSAAQGDMGRTLESPANQMRIFKEQVNLAMISLGQGLIPVMQKVLKTVQPWIEKFKDLTDVQKEWIVKLLILAAAGGPLMLATGQILKMTSGIIKLKNAYIALSIAQKTAMLSTAGAVAAIGIAVAATGAYFYKYSEEIKEAEKSTNSFWYSLLIAGHKINPILGDVPPLLQEITDRAVKAAASALEFSDAVDKYGGAAEKTASAIDSMGEAADDAEKEIDSLTKTLWALYNINQSVTEATWDFEEAVKAAKEAKKELEKAEKAHGSTFTANDEALNTYLSTNINYLKNQEQQASAFKNLEEVKSKEGVTTLEILEADKRYQDSVAAGNEIIKEATKKTGEYNSTGQQTAKQLEETTIKTQEYNESIFDVQDALEGLQIKYEEARDSGKLTVEMQNKISQSFLESGTAAMKMGLMGQREFDAMAASLGVNKLLMQEHLLGLDGSLNQSTLKTQGLKAAIDELQSKDIYINTFHTDWYSMAENKPGQGNFSVMSGKSQKQSGGLQRSTGYIPDLGMIGVKDEAYIPAYIVRAIKDNKSSFMGLDTKGGASVQNYFNISELVVREEADVERIAQSLYSLQVSSLRGAGMR